MAVKKLVIAPADAEVIDVTAKPSGGAVPESLDALAHEADLLDTSPARDAAANVAAEAATLVSGNVAELLVTLETIKAMVFPLLEMVTDKPRMAALDQVWSDDVFQRSAEAGAAVMEKHGWTMGTLMGDYGCYLMLAAALGPPVILTKKILTVEKKPAPAAAPGQGGADVRAQ